MARHAVEHAPARSHPWKLYLLIGLAVLVIACLFLVLFWPGIQEYMWLGKLHSDNPNVRRLARADLAASERDGLDERLQGKLLDPDTAFGVRKQIGKILLRRGRLPMVEGVLRSDALEARVTGLAILFDHRHTLPESGDVWFKREYVENPVYRVKETVLTWLSREGDRSRLDAVSIAGELDIEEAIPLLRKLVRPTSAGVLSQRERGLITGAAQTLMGFGDCEVMPTLAEVAQTSADERVRLRLTQNLYQSVLGPGATCQDAVPRETVKSLVLGGLDGAPVVRQASLGILALEPTWTGEVMDRVRGILDGKEGDNPYVRRAALAALTAHGDEAFLRLIPRYFHADDKNIRSEAVSASRAVSDDTADSLHLASCWIGMVYDETENKIAFDSALGALSQVAGKWIGVPTSVRKDPKTRRAKMMAYRKEIFEQGESAGLSRQAWADAWFAWWAKKRGLSAENALKAAATRKAFWKAADAGRFKDAAATLIPWAEGPRGLFLYERAWLDVQS